MKSTKSLLKERISKILPMIDRHGFEGTVDTLVGMWENSRAAIQWHGEMLNEKILKYKKSETVFILGSGPSINSISHEEWKHIRQHDSVGFNFWMVHDFVPDFYMFQHRCESRLNILRDSYEKYKNIPFLIRGTELANGKFDYTDERLHLLQNNPLFYVNEYPIMPRCAIEPLLLYKYMEALGLMDFGRIADFVPKFRCTLGLLVPLSYQLGYKNIVLCGMDMQDNRHFWGDRSYSEVKKKYSLPEGAGITNFTDTRISPNTVPRYIYSLRDWMFEKSGVKIFIMKKKTILYPEIRLYEF